jgi:predicted Zn-ribbon and HTH transcriptional regulator
MNLKRKIERKELKSLRKSAKNAMKSVGAAIDAMPKACTACGAVFDTKLHPEQLDTWRVRITESAASLTCEECSSENS